MADSLTPPVRARLNIGIWMELDPRARWANEGMLRLLGFMIEGASKDGGPRFHILVRQGLETSAREDLRTLKAEEDVDWVVHTFSEQSLEPRSDHPQLAMRLLRRVKRMFWKDDDLWRKRMAAYANSHVPADGWVVLHPFFSGCQRLQKPYAVIFPDAIHLTFPVADAANWQPGGLAYDWRENVKDVLTKAPAIITFSQHVANRDLLTTLGERPAKVHVIPHAPPEVASQLPIIDPARPEATEATRAQAAELLRQHATESEWNYLQDFAFEDAHYIVVSTQDRPSKNLGIVADAVRQLLRDMHRDIKLITTAHLHYGAGWTRLPGIIESEQLQFDVVSAPDLPRPVHAALFHAAQLVVHPSIFEGGHAPFPFYEALSVGCPCIMARGPHTEELLQQEPELETYLFDPYDKDGLARLIVATLENREAVVKHQLEILGRLRQRTWGDVARAYAEAAIAGEQAVPA